MENFAAFVSIAAVIGLIVAFTMPKEYTSKVVLAPEVTSMGGSMLGGLGELVQSFGYDIGNSTSVDAIYPDIYPNIFHPRICDGIIGCPFAVINRRYEDFLPKPFDGDGKSRTD